jgi:predicted alpha/beta hydrolase
MTPLEIRITSRDGHVSPLRLHAADVPGAGVFWLPALGVPAAKYDAFSAALAGQGVACAVHEWRGNGGSSLRARRGVDWGYRELLEQDLAASVAALDPTRRWFFGGHSLGGQLAAMAATRAPECKGLILLATGVPHSRFYPGRQGWGISLFAHALPLLTRAAGYYPGENLGFAGREAGQLMRDWAATVRSGRYGHYEGEHAMESALARLELPVLGLRLTHDWLVPEASLTALLAKLGAGKHETEVFDDARLGTTADHFRWMRQPKALADRIAGWVRASP